MWGQTRPRPTPEARSLEQIDAWVYATVQSIFENRNVPENWEGAELQAITFEVEDTEGEDPQYGYQYWLNGIEVSYSDGVTYFTPGMLEERGGFIPPPTLAIDDIAAFLTGVYGRPPVTIRRYQVASDGEVTVVED